MPKKPTRKRPADLNRLAPAAIVAEVTNSATAQPEKNPAAVALGHMGGSKVKGAS